MKKGMNCAIAMVTALTCVALLSACRPLGKSSNNSGSYDDFRYGCVTEVTEDANYQYGSVVEQGFKTTAEAPSAYFSLDRNTAGYSLMRAQILSGNKIAKDSVRTEELFNYFTYDYPAPQEGEALKASAYVSDCPWNGAHKLLTVGIKSQERVISDGVNNYVFLVDVSGSMSSKISGTDDTALGLVKYGITQMTDGLSEQDSVSVVTYASGVKTVLEPTLADGAGKAEIKAAVNKLKASGSTFASGGLEVAYQNAQRYYSEHGNNRVIILSDGDFNVGLQNEMSLKEFIQDKAQSGIYLSVIAVGMGNMRDDFMQTLALNGNGNYAYIDGRREAEKVLSEELNGTLYTVADDAKASVTFTDAVKGYRILGYDMKVLSQEEYENEETDAGEIGSNLCVTCVFELEMSDGVPTGKLADISIRYKSADTKESKETSAEAFSDSDGGDDVRFISCVTEFALVLRDSRYKGGASLSAVQERLQGLREYLDTDVYKKEFSELVSLALTQEHYENS